MAWLWTKEVAIVAVLLGGSSALTNLDLAFATADPNERLKALVAAISAEHTVVLPLLPRAAQISRTADEKSANVKPVRGPASQEVMNGGGQVVSEWRLELPSDVENSLSWLMRWNSIRCMSNGRLTATLRNGRRSLQSSSLQGTGNWSQIYGLPAGFQDAVG